mgnify:CR=1 FL=1
MRRIDIQDPYEDIRIALYQLRIGGTLYPMASLGEEAHVSYGNDITGDGSGIPRGYGDGRKVRFDGERIACNGYYYPNGDGYGCGVGGLATFPNGDG